MDCGEVRRHSTGQGRVEDGQHEFLYGRAISPYFDLQAGLRTDPDSGTTRDWAAFGFRGLAPYFFDLEATGYVSDQGHLAARIKASYDVLITQRLILQPEARLWPSDHPENRAPAPAQRLVKNCDAPRCAFLSRGILSWTGRCCGRDLLLGFLIAGALSAFVLDTFWQTLRATTRSWTGGVYANAD